MIMFEYVDHLSGTARDLKCVFDGGNGLLPITDEMAVNYEYMSAYPSGKTSHNGVLFYPF